MKVTKCCDALGARVEGLELSTPLDAATVEAIKEAWREHLVLVFPGQELTLEQQVTFSENFGVLMEHCSLEQAERVALSLCQAIEGYQYVWEDRTFRVGCSIGVVPISEASMSAQMVMSSADTACYAAKDPLGAQQELQDYANKFSVKDDFLNLVKALLRALGVGAAKTK